MAKIHEQLHEVAPQCESINDALELARQTAATTQPNSMPTPTDDRWLAAYGDQWRSHQMEGLELRWQIGTSCNEHLGGPMTVLPDRTLQAGSGAGYRTSIS